ncbi:MAG: hypothetical protein GX937_10510 [Lentisphaerae bacterium]|jgi:hypothetical protein|nr:hypothetical protein [Lentisphaerota bacterium]
MWKAPIEEFRENTRASWEFALKGAWDQHRRHPNLSRKHCLQERSFFWEIIRSREVPIFEKCGQLAEQVSDVSEMEQLYPEVLARAEELYAKLGEEKTEYEEGRSLRGVQHPTQKAWCYMHIRNAKKPESFLQHPAHVADDLRLIMAQSEKAHGCTELYTASWLNSYPGFQRFFPEAWRSNIKPVSPDDLGPTTGWQGQFYNRRGMLNTATASRFLETGRLPFLRVETHCPFALVRQHLKNLGL